jgi:DNA mismatch repair protein MSH4
VTLFRAAQGRATSTSDGFAIAFAASEHLLSCGAFSLCATHMERLNDLGAIYTGAKQCHLRIVALNDRIQFVHELTEARNALAVS